MHIRNLILELKDQLTSCVLNTLEFDAEESHELLILLGIEEAGLKGVIYDISAADLARIRAAFPLKKISVEVSQAWLRARGAWDDLPYSSHTSRELLMMLKGKKPLAVFCDAHPWTSQILIEMCEKFESYVKAGRFVKHEHLEINVQDQSQSVSWIFFAPPAEAWRINAYILMKKTAKFSGWNDALERLEGSLLGYSDEQNSIHLLRNK